MLLENNFLYQKKQKKRLLTTILIIAFLLFFCFILLFVNGRSNSLFTKNSFYPFHGILQENNNYPLYTHSLIGSGETPYFFKSSTINLNNFAQQNIELGSIFMKTEDKKDIFEVNLLKDLEHHIIYKKNTSIFLSDLLLINTNEDNNILAQKNNGKIEVSYNNIPAFSIDTFFCNKVVPGYDCEMIRKELKKKFVDTFQSPLGYHFYKVAEKTWYVLDKDDMISYIITAPDTDILVNLSYIITFIDKKYILAHKKDSILQQCLGPGEVFKDIEVITHSIVDSKYFKFTFSIGYGTSSSDKKQTRSCMIDFDISSLDFWKD